MSGELTSYVQPAAQGRKIVLLLDIAARHSFSDGLGEFVAKYPDQDFQQRLSLPRQFCYRPEIEFQNQSDGQHVD